MQGYSYMYTYVKNIFAKMVPGTQYALKKNGVDDFCMRQNIDFTCCSE